jgi:hypothetical protein
MGAGQPAEDGITALGLDYRLLTAFTSFIAIDSQVVNAGGQGQNVRQPLPMPEGVSNLAVSEPSAAAPMKSIGGGAYGHGSGSGTMGARRVMSAPIAPSPVSPAPPPGRHSRAIADEETEAPRDDRAPRAAKREDKPAKDEKASNKMDARKAPAGVATWIVTASKASSVSGPAPLVAAIRAALASGRAACLSASDVAKSIRIRLTIDAQGRIMRVELVSGDRSAGACLRAALAGLSSATVAQGPVATGTVEITLRARS